MRGGAEEDRRARVLPCLDLIPDRRGHEMASLPIPDELLAEILLRLPTPADLVRASAVSVSFRRVAAYRSFLRRYRKLHAPPLLGFFDSHRRIFHFHPASDVALAADFSFSLLPAPAPAPARDWVVQDIRDGRVVLNRWSPYPLDFKEAVVCDPLHRRYLLLPPIVCDLAGLLRVEIFLVPPGCGVEAEAAAAHETSFRVISMAQCKTRPVAFVFSSNTGQWRAVQPRCWTDLSAGLTPFKEMKLFDLRRPGMFVLAANACDLSYFTRQNDGGTGSQWQKVKTISLGSWARLIGNIDKYLLLHYRQSSLLEPACFTLDIETFQLEMVCPLGYDYLKLHTYSTFPRHSCRHQQYQVVLKKGLRRRRWNKAGPQAQVHSHHGCQTSAVV